jgi:hypothetical protein
LGLLTALFCHRDSQFFSIPVHECINFIGRNVTNLKLAKIYKHKWLEFQAFQLGIQKALSKLQTLVPDQGEKSV